MKEGHVIFHTMVQSGPLVIRVDVKGERIDSIIMTDDASDTYTEIGRYEMDENIRKFVLDTLNDAYANARDNEYRARQQQERMPMDHDNNEAVRRYTFRSEVAKKALAYFGVYR